MSCMRALLFYLKSCFVLNHVLICVWVYAHECRCLQRVGFPEVELKVVANFSAGVLGTDRGFSAGAAIASDPQGIFRNLYS